MLELRGLVPVLLCLCSAAAACGGESGDSASNSASAASGTDDDSDPSAGPTAPTPTSGAGDASTASDTSTTALTTGAVSVSGDTGTSDTTASADTTTETSPGDTSTSDDSTAGDSTSDGSTTGDSTSDDSTSTGGDDPWDCEGGDPITVNEGGKYTTLAAAVAAAPPNATITVCAGTYVETVVIDRPMTLIGAGQGNTFLDGGGMGTPIFIDAVTVTIEGFTFQHGEAEHNPLGNSLCGGGLAIDHDNTPMVITVKDCTFTDNHGQYGGAICYDGSGNDNSAQQLVLDGVRIEDNSASVNGGGLFSYSSTTMTDTVIIKNTAGNQGGGIYFSYSDNVIDGGAIKQNTADEGGGMFLQSPVTVDVNASDWGFGQNQENVPNDVQHYANEYGFFGAGVSFFCEYIVWNMGMCALD